MHDVIPPRELTMQLEFVVTQEEADRLPGSHAGDGPAHPDLGVGTVQGDDLLGHAERHGFVVVEGHGEGGLAAR